MNYEELQMQNADLNMKEMDLSEVPGLKGLYYNGNIAIEKKLTQTQKACVLAEELGHHYTTVGISWISPIRPPGSRSSTPDSGHTIKWSDFTESSVPTGTTAGLLQIWQNIWMSQNNSWLTAWKPTGRNTDAA